MPRKREPPRKIGGISREELAAQGRLPSLAQERHWAQRWYQQARRDRVDAEKNKIVTIECPGCPTLLTGNGRLSMTCPTCDLTICLLGSSYNRFQYAHRIGVTP